MSRFQIQRSGRVIWICERDTVAGSHPPTCPARGVRDWVRADAEDVRAARAARAAAPAPGSRRAWRRGPPAAAPVTHREVPDARPLVYIYASI